MTLSAVGAGKLQAPEGCNSDPGAGGHLLCRKECQHAWHRGASSAGRPLCDSHAFNLTSPFPGAEHRKHRRETTTATRAGTLGKSTPALRTVPTPQGFYGCCQTCWWDTVINRAGGDHGCPAQTRLKQTAGCIRPKPSPRHVLAAREASTCPRPAARAAPELTGYPRGAQRPGTTSWYTHPRPSHAPAPCCFPICRLQNRQLCHPN